jgi:hypothetical protein
LVDVMKRDIKGTPALMSKTLGGASTLIDELDRFESKNLAPNVQPASKKRAMEDLLKEVANPHRYINQGDRGTCTCTSMSFNLALSNPAEYARLVTDLATTGQAKLANGATITPPADAFANDTSRRSVGERLFQSALMNYATGGTYQNASKNTGLELDEQVRALGGLYGKSFTSIPNMAGAGLAATKMAIESGRVPVYARMEWGGGGHAVEVLKVEDGKVYIRNPWGGNVLGTSKGVGIHGQKHTDPPRQTVDSENGIEVMTEDDYVDNLKSIVVGG